MLMMILTIDGITRVCLSKRAEIREELLKLCQVGPWGESMRMLKNKNIVLNIHQKTWGFVIFSNTFSWRWARQRRWCWTVNLLLLLKCHVWETFFYLGNIFCLGNIFLFEWVTWTLAFQPNLTFFALTLVITLTITRNQVLFSLSMPLAEQNYQSLKWALFRIILLSFFVFLIYRTLFFMETWKR